LCSRIINDKSFDDYLKVKTPPENGLGPYDQQALKLMNRKWYDRLKAINHIEISGSQFNGLSKDRDYK